MPVLCRLSAFRLCASWIAPLRSQTTRATNCATPGYLIFCFLEISLSVVIPVVKGDSAASSRRREKPENARVVQAFSVSALRIMDSTAALPNHPRYQLRYTRIYWLARGEAEPAEGIIQHHFSVRN
jgi:hypothetical protein